MSCACPMCNSLDAEVTSTGGLRCCACGHVWWPKDVEDEEEVEYLAELEREERDREERARLEREELYAEMRQEELWRMEHPKEDAQ